MAMFYVWDSKLFVCCDNGEIKLKNSKVLKHIAVQNNTEDLEDDWIIL
jgi:hypothetical protein